MFPLELLWCTSDCWGSVKFQLSIYIVTPELEDSPMTFRSTVWQHYSFLVSHRKDGQRLVSNCVLTLFSWSWVCLWKHFKHECVDQQNETEPDWKASPSPHSVQQLLTAESHRSNIWCYRVFMAADVWSDSVVEDTGFKHVVKVVKVLEPRYNEPSCMLVSLLCCPV